MQLPNESYASLRNLRFLLFEVLDSPGLSALPWFEGYDREAFELTLDAAKQLADRYLFPYYRAMDKDKAYFDGEQVRVHAAMKPGIKAIAEGGWISAPQPFGDGGQQMPLTLHNAGLFLFYAANANLASHPFLTAGAANLIRTFGSQDLKDLFLDRMYQGDWQGTMALTEPQAGSSLSDIISSAQLAENGLFRIRGQKIYISGGDHDAVENVVHLLLARIEGAPAGTKGISLFVVPKFMPSAEGLKDNHVTTAGIYGKMGQKGYVAAHLMLGEQGDCLGYLVGEPNKGLTYMFQMMNEARIATGLMATGAASGAYYASLKYAHERAQGRHPSNKDLTQPPVLIIDHADVRRMLLFQKAAVEGSLGILLKCSYYADLAHAGEGGRAIEAQYLLELLTPVAKSYPAEMGILSVSQGMQVLGGAGYTDDFPLEQYYRDIRVNAIYEGTTGIHGMDLLGRKIFLAEGKAMTLLMKEVKSTINQGNSFPELAPYAGLLAQRAAALHQTTMKLIQLATTETPEVFLADATLYLEFMGHLVAGWVWMEQGIAAVKGLANSPNGADASFYMGKIQTLRYFYEYELPKTLALEARLNSTVRVTMETKPEFLH